MAQDVERRLRALQMASPAPLRLLGVMPGGELEEGLVHDLLADHRIRGEWFRPDDEVLDYLTTPRGQVPLAVARYARSVRGGSKRPPPFDMAALVGLDDLAQEGGDHSLLAGVVGCAMARGVLVEVAALGEDQEEARGKRGRR